MKKREDVRCIIHPTLTDDAPLSFLRGSLEFHHLCAPRGFVGEQTLHSTSVAHEHSPKQDTMNPLTRRRALGKTGGYF